MPIKKNLLISLFIAFIFIFTIVLYNQNQVKEINNVDNNFLGEWEQVFADTPCDGSSHNIEGWAYASPIGPISLSCTNETASVNYGVNINESFSQPASCCSGAGIVCDCNYSPVYTGSENYYHVKINSLGNGGSGQFIVPDLVYGVDVTVVGGGAAGNTYSSGYSNGGAGGYVTTKTSYGVTPGEAISVVIGAGGTYNTSSFVRSGKRSSFGSVSVNDTYENPIYRSNGGSGGGGYSSSTYYPGAGGSNGSNGVNGTYSGGYGQGTSTRGIDGKLYAAGGGAGSFGGVGANGGADDFGNAGRGGSSSTGFIGTNATPGSGSGGGGGSRNPSTNKWSNGGNGGSGVVIVRYLKPQMKDLSGYAWSSAIGPISFNENEICANGNCTGAFPAGAGRTTNYGAKVEYVSDGVAKITGWARALGACNFDFTNGYCTTNGAGSDAGGWDGWIKFDKDSTVNYSKGSIVAWRSNCDNVYCTMRQEDCEWLLNAYCNNGYSQFCADEFYGYDAVCAFPVYEHGGVGTVYNTYIQSIDTAHVGTEGRVKQHFLRGTAWGGDILDGRTPPSSVLGEIVFLNAETTYNPNNACTGSKPVASFKLGCLNGEVSSSGTCYFNVGSNVNLLNKSSDPDEVTCSLTNDIKTSTWSPVGGTVSGKANSSFSPTDTASYTQNISLTVEDYQGLTSDPFNGSWTLKKAIQTNFSCCIKNVNGGSDCSANSHFKNCNDSGFSSLTVTEDTTLYLRDNISLTTQHTIPASGLSVASRSWTYPQGAVSGSGENINIPIKQGGVLTLTATDSSGLSDSEPKTLNTMFTKINKNPDFKEIPFD